MYLGIDGHYVLLLAIFEVPLCVFGVALKRVEIKCRKKDFGEIVTIDFLNCVKKLGIQDAQ